VLKRKDYLHDEAKEKTITLSSLSYSVESALVNLENIETEHAANQRSIGYSRSSTEDNLQLKEFAQFMEELKTSLYLFAEQNKNKAFSAFLDKLYSDADLDTRSILNKIDFELRGLQE